MSNENPYQAPSANVNQPSEELTLLEPRRVSAGQGWRWIADGFSLFAKSPVIWIVNFVLFMVMMAFSSFVPFLSSVLGPIFTGGFMLGAQALDEGEALEVNHLFAGFNAEGGKLAIVGLLYLAGFFVLFFIFGIIMIIAMFAFGIFDAIVTQGVQPDLQLIFSLYMIFMLLVLGFSMPLIMAYWFAPALVVFHKKEVMDAMKLSFIGCWRNIIPFTIYSIIGLMLVIVASLPLFLGLLVVIPVFIASMYTSYRDIYT